MKRYLDNEFSRFLLVGGIAAAVNFVSRLVLSDMLLMGYGWAVFFAYLVGMLTAWLLSRLFVFAPSGKHPAHELLYFTLVNIAALAQVWVISVGLAEYLFPFVEFHFHPEEIAHAIGLAVPAVTSYFGHKYFSFGRVTG